MQKITVCLLLLMLASCTRQMRGPVIPKVLGTPLYGQAQYTSDLQIYRASTSDAATELRNRIVHGIMADVEYNYRVYESTLFIDRAKFNVGSDLLELGLATAGTLSSVNYTKTILSTLLSAGAGARISADKNFFREKAIESVINSMQSRRNRVEQLILAQLAKPVFDYPLELAIKDVREYFFAGTLEGGLTEMSQQSAAAAQTNQMLRDQTKSALVQFIATPNPQKRP